MASGSSVPEWPTLRVPSTPAGLGDDVVAGPAGRLVDDREPVGTGGPPSATATSSSWISRRTSSRRAAPRPTSSGLKTSSGVRFTRAWRPMAPCSAVAVLAERLEHVLVVVLAAEGVVVHGGVAEVGVAVDRHDRDQLEAVVVDLLELLGEDLLEELVEPGRARIVAGGRVLRARVRLAMSIPLLTMRGISRSSKVSMMSPCLRSWKSVRPMPHSKPACTSRTSSLKRRSELTAPFQMIVPSRRKRTLEPRVMVPLSTSSRRSCRRGARRRSRAPRPRR